jgi:hypothetical protein
MRAIRRHCQKPTHFRGLPMSSTFDTVANIISETCDIEREKITPDSHAIDDLGIDSLDFPRYRFRDRQGVRDQAAARAVDPGGQ